MKFNVVNDLTAQDILAKRWKTKLNDVLDKFVKANIQVAEIDEQDVKRYNSALQAVQSLRGAVDRYNKKHKTFLSAIRSGDHVYLVNRSIG